MYWSINGSSHPYQAYEHNRGVCADPDQFMVTATKDRDNKRREFNWKIGELSSKKTREEYREEIERQLRNNASDGEDLGTKWKLQ